MECTLCGRSVPFLNKAEIEGSIIGVCDKCLTFGIKILDRHESTQPTVQM